MRGWGPGGMDGFGIFMIDINHPAVMPGAGGPVPHPQDSSRTAASVLCPKMKVPISTETTPHTSRQHLPIKGSSQLQLPPACTPRSRAEQPVVGRDTGRALASAHRVAIKMTGISQQVPPSRSICCSQPCCSLAFYQTVGRGDASSPFASFPLLSICSTAPCVKEGTEAPSHTGC